MCAYCKSIRNDQNYWEKVETYFTQHSNVSFTHSYCPNCYERSCARSSKRSRTRARHRNSTAPLMSNARSRSAVIEPAAADAAGEPDVLAEVLQLFLVRCRRE
jgi:hypothetical protein